MTKAERAVECIATAKGSLRAALRLLDKPHTEATLDEAAGLAASARVWICHANSSLKGAKA